METTEGRRRAIAAKARENSSVRVGELSKLFGVSTETIRTDLMELADRGVVERVHGGALVKTSTESHYDIRRQLNVSEKASISNAALNYALPSSTIFLDYGTTTLSLARRISKTGLDVTAVAVSMPIVNEMLQSPRVDLVVPGGSIRRNENSLWGPLTEHTVASMFFDVGFFSCAALSPEHGMTNHHAPESKVSRLALSHCSTVVLMVDHTKLRQPAAIQTAPLKTVDVIITDQPLPEQYARAAQSAKCRVIYPD